MPRSRSSLLILDSRLAEYLHPLMGSQLVLATQRNVNIKGLLLG